MEHFIFPECTSDERLYRELLRLTELCNIYVVSYTCAKELGEMVQEAVSVTLEKMHPCADYAKVWIDGNGEVNTAEETVL